jgi:pimeloyl-ACP methyl ester carboxylesterase
VSERTESGLAYEVAGDGPAVLLIHEGIGDRAMWEPQWRSGEWRDRFTMIRFDQRGFGESEDPLGPYSLHGDALAVLDAAGADRAAVLGASMGGAAAIDLALAHPERVSALVAVAATPSGWEHSDEHMSRFAEIDEVWQRDGIDAANELELRMWVDGVGRQPGDVDPTVRAEMSRMNRALIERQGEWDEESEPVELDPPAIGRLDQIAVPVLVVTGEHDQRSVNAGAAALAQATAAETVEVPDTAHAINLERPAEFDRAVVPFLDRALADRRDGDVNSAG